MRRRRGRGGSSRGPRRASGTLHRRGDETDLDTAATAMLTVAREVLAHGVRVKSSGTLCSSTSTDELREADMRVSRW